MEMSGSDKKDDMLFAELAIDVGKAREHLDYLTGKRTFFQYAGMACLVLAVIARVIARTESLPDLNIGVFLFGFSPSCAPGYGQLLTHISKR